MKVTLSFVTLLMLELSSIFYPNFLLILICSGLVCYLTSHYWIAIFVILVMLPPNMYTFLKFMNVIDNRRKVALAKKLKPVKSDDYSHFREPKGLFGTALQSPVSDNSSPGLHARADFASDMDKFKLAKPANSLKRPKIDTSEGLADIQEAMADRRGLLAIVELFSVVAIQVHAHEEMFELPFLVFSHIGYLEGLVIYLGLKALVSSRYIGESSQSVLLIAKSLIAIVVVVLEITLGPSIVIYIVLATVAFLEFCIIFLTDNGKQCFNFFLDANRIALGKKQGVKDAE